MNAEVEIPIVNKLFKTSVLAWRAKYLASRSTDQQSSAEEKPTETDEPSQIKVTRPRRFGNRK